jgi:hypothetical protein
MRYAIALDYRKFFNETGLFLVEELFPEPLCAQILASAKLVVKKRVPSAMDNRRIGDKLGRKEEMNIRLSRDIWRDDLSLRRILLQPQFCQLVQDLFGISKTKLAFDHLFSADDFLSDGKERSVQSNLACSFAEGSSIQGVIGGMIICLSAPKVANNLVELNQSRESADPITADENRKLVIERDDEGRPIHQFVLPQKVGSALYFKSSLPVDIEAQVTQAGGNYLLVAYGFDPLIYIHNSKDVANHYLKELGYVFGDRLKESTHPLLHA